MARPLLHFNRLESAFSAAHSVVGDNWTVTGSPSYAAVKYGNGVDIDSDAKYLSIASFTGLDENQGAFEFWIKPHFAAGGGAGLDTVFHLGLNGAGGIDMFFWHNVGSSRFEFQVRANGGTQTCMVHTGSQSWSADDVIHIGLPYDVTWTAKRARIYWNGSDISTLFRNDDWTVGALPSPNPIRLGNLLSGGNHANAVIDNFKVWNYSKTAYDDRNIERAGLVDVIS